MACPKCGSVNTYVIDGMGACRTCGGRWLPEGQNPYNKRNMEEEDMKKGVCGNCSRGPMGIVAHDLCGGCYAAVRNYGWGTSECQAALAEAKKRFSDPSYKRGGGRKPKKGRQGGGAKARPLSNDAIIERLQEQRDEHLLAAKKLDEAITLLDG